MLPDRTLLGFVILTLFTFFAVGAAVLGWYAGAALARVLGL